MLSRPLIGRVDQNSLQAFYKRFSGHERTQMSDRQGADARRDATSGQFVCLCCPGAGALDQQSSARCWQAARDRKSTRLNSSHGYISYAVFCLKKKKKKQNTS